MKVLAKSSGFTLIQALVTLGVISVGAVFFLGFFETTQKGQRVVQNSFDYGVLKTSIKMILDNPSLCATGLRNAAGTAAAKFNAAIPVAAADQLGSIYLGASPVAKVGQSLGGGLTISELKFLDTGVSSGPDALGNMTYYVKIILKATKASGSLGGSTLSNEVSPFLLSVVTDPSKRITSCTSTSANVPLPGTFCGNAVYAGGRQAVIPFTGHDANSGPGVTYDIPCQGIIPGLSPCPAGYTVKNYFTGFVATLNSWYTCAKN